MRWYTRYRWCSHNNIYFEIREAPTGRKLGHGRLAMMEWQIHTGKSQKFRHFVAFNMYEASDQVYLGGTSINFEVFCYGGCTNVSYSHTPGWDALQ